MRTHKIACQMITFGGFSDKAALMDTLVQLKDCGYDGIECGYDSIEMLEQTDLERVGLEICATHTCIDFKAPEFDPEAVLARDRALIEKSSRMGCRLAFVSAFYYPSKTRADFEEEARFYTRYGQMTREFGVDFCFHNHHWEFKNRTLGFNTYFETWDDEYVHLVPDVGWLTRADVDPVGFLCAHHDQVKAVHFKEFTFDDRFTELGRGIVEFPRIYDFIKADPLWIIAEQDSCQGAPIDAVRENARYLIDLMDGKIVMPSHSSRSEEESEPTVPEHKIACALIVYGDINTRERMLEIVRDVRDAGYDGFECGIDSLRLIEKADLDAIGIAPFAVHTCLNFQSDVPPLEQIEQMRPLLQKSREMGAQYLFLSALAYMGKSREDYLREADVFNRLGRVSMEYGLPLCYHNHHWEFKRHMTGFRAYFERFDPEYVHLVPDVGWVTRGGVNPVIFLAEHRDQVKALHFKDFTFDDHFTELGRGIVDFRGIYEYARPIENLWIVAEQDTCQGAPGDSARENLRYLRKLTAE